LNRGKKTGTIKTVKLIGNLQLLMLG